MSSHEPLHSHRAVAAASNRTFGLVIGAAFGVVGLWPLLRYGQSPRYWAAGLAVAFVLCAAIAPDRLAPLNRLWFKLGAALHGIMSPVVMAILFYGLVTPFGFAMRLLGKDLLSLRRSDADSYWVERETPGPAPGSMKNQF